MVPVKGVRVPGGVWLSVLGESVFLPDDQAGSAPSRREAAGGDARSPMPGRVVRIFVKAAQQVKTGESLVAVEAMKMEYLVRAPGDGVVKALRCAEGQAVQQGQVLLDWEPA